MRYFAWYSPKAARLFGHVIWTTKIGTHINATEIALGRDEESVNPVSTWPDLVFLGEVVKWVDRVDGQIGLESMSNVELYNFLRQMAEEDNPSEHWREHG